MKLDEYEWAALYTDETCICEYDDPDGLGFASVDQSRVKAFTLTSTSTPLHVHRIDLPAGATPIFFRRRSRVIYLLTEHIEQPATTHCIGWRKDDSALYLFVFDDGSTLLTTDLQAV